MTTVNGHCHCGQTEYTVKFDKAPSHILCHCDACKVVSGAEATLNQVVPQENIKITKGNLGKYVYKGDSGNEVQCYFCPNCTTHVYHHQTVMGPKYVVRTASLDGAKDWPVSAEIYAKDLLKWQKPVAPSVFQETPPS